MTELLTVIAIVGVLVAILIPTVSLVRVRAKKSVSLSNLRQIVLSLRIYAADNDGTMPRQYDGTMDWSGILTVSGTLPSPDVFNAPADDTERSELTPPDGILLLRPRSYAINSAKFTFTGNGYQTPWPVDRRGAGGRIDFIPGHVMLVGENWGGAITGSRAYVGVAENEGIDAYPRNLYGNTGAGYGFADGSVRFLSADEMNTYRADTDYDGNPQDPWKWR